jgi:hypothetical protein
MTDVILQNFLAFLNAQKRNLEDLETFYEKNRISLGELGVSRDTMAKLCHDVIEQKSQEALQKKTSF